MKTLFALDVGTRKVAGLLAIFDEETLTVMDFETIEHPVRSMLDGQIHDIKSVARIVEKVKRNLESRNDVSLDDVAVAVAGRYLKTQIVEASLKIPSRAIDERIVRELEAQALSKISFLDESGTRLYCAGYSALEYKLDGLWVKNPIGHRGEELYAKLIVAMLPNQVIDAMMSALHLAGLRCSFLTLEPMAALEVAVPDELRFLNIALVDIGAGTSDIAIAKAGNVIGYDMVAMAGDEITEAIAQYYLLDFKTAEMLKRSIETRQRMEVRNLTGETIVVERSDLERVVEPIVSQIAENIAQRIESLNLGKTSAVLLVGGGAKLSLLRQKIAEALHLPKERVALKSVEECDRIKSVKEGFVGSEYVTLAGIAYMKAKEIGSVYDVVKLNGEEVRLLKLDRSPTVLQLLTQCGYSVRDLIGKVQPSISYRLNGELRTVSGFVVKRYRVKLNGKECTLHQTLRNGDEVEVEPLGDENVNTLKLKDLVKPIRVFLNNSEIFSLLPTVILNNEEIQELDRTINDGDEITIRWPTEEEILQSLKEKLGFINYSMNGEMKRISKFKLNLKTVEKNEHEIRYLFEGTEPKIKDILPEPQHVNVKFNGKEIRIFQKNHTVLVNGEYISSDASLQDGMEIFLPKFEPIVVDVLASVEIDTKNLKDYTILLNGKPASFIDPIKENDEVNFIPRSKALDETEGASQSSSE
ncbi:MAG: rod shape-determining protein [Pseudothermotoga sp.]|nr:rod shape-determining protein [Pseudothermotoga sp.]